MSKSIFTSHTITDKYGDPLEVSANPHEVFVSVYEDAKHVDDPGMVSLTRGQAEELVLYLQQVIKSMEE